MLLLFSTVIAGDMPPPSVTLQQAYNLRDWTVGLRRDLHKCPELLYDLKETSAYVRKVLDGLHIPYQYPVAQEGIVATIGTGEAPCVALRADMDALPIHEEVESRFRSETDGKMHACGHDAHTSMLLTAARLLKEREGSLSGTVKLLFQPAEEGGAGGLAMVEAGVLQVLRSLHLCSPLHRLHSPGSLALNDVYNHRSCPTRRCTPRSPRPVQAEPQISRIFASAMGVYAS